jgi:hypothetical protein
LITITRQRARRLRAVFRRRVLGIHHRGTIPPLVLHAEGARLRAQHLYQHLAVEYVEPGAPRQLDSVTLPLEALADFEGRDENPVVLESPVEFPRRFLRTPSALFGDQGRLRQHTRNGRQ